MYVWKLFKGVYDENHILYCKHFPPFISFSYFHGLLFYFLQYSAYSPLIKIHDVEEYQEKAPSVDKENFTYNC